jgi:hypothetical protein
MMFIFFFVYQDFNTLETDCIGFKNSGSTELIQINFN